MWFEHLSLGIFLFSPDQGLTVESLSGCEVPVMEVPLMEGKLLALDPAVLMELQKVFNPEMAYITYIPFSCLLGMAWLPSFLELLVLCAHA